LGAWLGVILMFVSESAGGPETKLFFPDLHRATLHVTQCTMMRAQNLNAGQSLRFGFWSSTNTLTRALEKVLDFSSGPPLCSPGIQEL